VELTEMVEDRIERDIVVPAPIAQVWATVTEAEHIGSWFGTGGPARIDLRPGGRIFFNHGPHGDIPARVATVERPRRFSFRWVVSDPYDEEPRTGNSTLVEFTLTGDGTKTSVHVTESGYAALDLPPADVATRFAANAQGWPDILGKLGAHAETLTTVR
jgi:uncharacterized protein YndB with AHSA1/START domain